MAIWGAGQTERSAALLERRQPVYQRAIPVADCLSVSRSGNVWDNAGMESFFSSLKIAGLPPWRNLGKVWLNG
jgi:hypothetical protein